MKKKNAVAFIGQGFVGGSMARALVEKGLDVHVTDLAGKHAEGTKFHSTIEELVAVTRGVSKPTAPIVFVCLPTPMRQDGSCDVSIVYQALEKLALLAAPMESGIIAVVKSTVPPGSTEEWNKVFKLRNQNLKIVFNPEFLREATALDDARTQSGRIILGGPKEATTVVRDFFSLAFPDVPVHRTSSTNAEMTKYVINCFLATKVSFANEIFQLCSSLKNRGVDIDYDRVIEHATLDERLGSSHWRVPGPMPSDDGTGRLLPGFSGSCFIKDLNALISLMNSYGVDPKVLNGAWQKNLEVRPGKDWEKLIGRAVVKNDKE